MTTPASSAPGARAARPLDEQQPTASNVVSTVGNVADTTSYDVAGQLAGLRLGAHERRILLLAPSYASGGKMGEGAVIGAAVPGRSAAEAHRRALRRLADAALVYAMRESVYLAVERPTRIPVAWVAGGKGVPSGHTAATTLVSLPASQRYWHAAAFLTPLGAAVVEVLRPELDAGRSIRWSAYAGAIAAALPRHEADEAAAWARSDARLSALTAALGQLTREAPSARAVAGF